MNTMKAYIFLADGFEDTEALGTRDVLVRAGISVQLAGIGDDPFVVSSHGLTVSVDTMLDMVRPQAGDMLVFPGGMPGSKRLAECGGLVSLMKSHYAGGGCLAAICAAPGLVLGQLDDLSGIEMTCFDGFEDALTAKGATFVKKAAVTSGRIITGRSAGYSIDFGLEIARKMAGEDAAAKAAAGLLLPVE